VFLEPSSSGDAWSFGGLSQGSSSTRAWNLWRSFLSDINQKYSYDAFCKDATMVRFLGSDTLKGSMYQLVCGLEGIKWWEQKGVNNRKQITTN
jgi:hypothetical protein